MTLQNLYILIGKVLEECPELANNNVVDTTDNDLNAVAFFKPDVINNNITLANYDDLYVPGALKTWHI